ncbi:MAG: hypothetical protein J3Q66DRAFT_439345 [Benniella sp.]|nr:MAG: hypothetical protein J3Q66DRAFT_439345 [Benniella sp.]
MVKLSLSFVAMATALASIAAAVPHCREETIEFYSISTLPPKCVDDGPQEGESFRLLDQQFDKYLSAKAADKKIITGTGQKDLKELKFCIFDSTSKFDWDCKPWAGHCMDQNKTYRIRIDDSTGSYLKVNADGSVVFSGTKTDSTVFRFTQVSPSTHKVVTIANVADGKMIGVTVKGSPVIMQKPDGYNDQKFLINVHPDFTEWDTEIETEMDF